jgi:hypothetical protein
MSRYWRYKVTGRCEVGPWRLGFDFLPVALGLVKIGIYNGDPGGVVVSESEIETR